MHLLEVVLEDGEVSPTLRLREFIGESIIPPYAILSHTWDGDGVSYTEVVTGDYAGKKGLSKILRTLEQTHQSFLQYAWVDTCCIDKSSSADLSESINSMFRFYQEAWVCFAFLSDIDSEEKLTDSRCFTRGWTLQELIAPTVLLFYDMNWKSLGSRYQLSIPIHRITRIPDEILRSESVREKLSTCSVAQRISWAAKRSTTRVEDAAYCLLGIFDIAMPLLYGEGPKAFRRLQLEILRTIDSVSVLAWRGPFTLSDGVAVSTLRSPTLAGSPADFDSPYDIIWHSPPPNLRIQSITWTARGLQLNGPIMRNKPLTWPRAGSDAVLILSCSYGSDLTRLLGLPLMSSRLLYAGEGQLEYRSTYVLREDIDSDNVERAQRLITVDSLTAVTESKHETILICKEHPILKTLRLTQSPPTYVWIRFKASQPGEGWASGYHSPSKYWNKSNNVFDLSTAQDEMVSAVEYPHIRRGYSEGTVEGELHFQDNLGSRIKVMFIHTVGMFWSRGLAFGIGLSDDPNLYDRIRAGSSTLQGLRSARLQDGRVLRTDLSVRQLCGGDFAVIAISA